MFRVLVVEDDSNLNKSMCSYLNHNGYEATGIVFSRDKLLNDIWGYEFSGETRTVDVHIRTLRQKLGDAGELIETIRGVGYRMAAVK